MWREAARYEPAMGEDERESLLADWHRALERAKGWAAARAPARGAVTARRGRGYRVATAGRGRRSPMADMKPQVYKDERPAEYFDQFHAAARKGVGWTYTFVRIILSLPTLLIYRVRAIGVENVPKSGAADPRPQPLQPDGPLLHRPLPAPQGALHGQVADVRPARAHLHLQARRRLPGPPRPPRRGGDQDRRSRSSSRARCCSSTPRAAARAAASWERSSRGSAASRSNPVRPWCRSRSTARRRCAAGSGSASPR